MTNQPQPPQPASPKPTICFIAITAFPGLALPELQHMSAQLAQRGWPQLIIAKRESGQLALEHNGPVTIIRLWCRNRIEVESFFWRATRIVRRERPRLVHALWRFGAGMVPLLVGPLRPHCLLDVRTGSIDPRTWRRQLENVLLRFDRAPYRWVSTLDEGLDRALHLKADAYVPMGTASTWRYHQLTVQDRDNHRERLGFMPTEVVGIYLGTSVWRKLPILFEAFRRARETDAHLRLLVIGDAASNPQLVHSAAGEGIRVQAAVPYDKLTPWLACADFGIAFVPQTPGFTHQQSTKIFDYFSFHLPVLATKTAANQTFIADGRNGVLTSDTTESVRHGLIRMSRLLAEANFRQTTAEHADRCLQRYSWDAIVTRQLLPLYERILAV